MTTKAPRDNLMFDSQQIVPLLFELHWFLSCIVPSLHIKFRNNLTNYRKAQDCHIYITCCSTIHTRLIKKCLTIKDVVVINLINYEYSNYLNILDIDLVCKVLIATNNFCLL